MVVEIVPVLVVEIVPPRLVVETATTKIPVQTRALKFFMVLLLVA